MRKIDFYRLPRPVQDRFAASTRGTAPPLPLHFQAAPRTAAWAWLGASAVFAAIAGLLLRAGSGDTESSLALHGVAMIVVDIALLAGAAYGVFHAIAILRALEASPYRPGTYVFPACVVDAREDRFRVWSVSEAEGVDVVANASPALALRMADGTRLVFPSSSVDEAKRVEDALAQLRPRLTRALAEDDPHQLAELDPLHDNAMSSPIGPTEAMQPTSSVWIRFDWAIAIGAGVALGLVLGSTRNAMSDDAMFRTAATADTIPAYKAYLAQGGGHSEEVRDLLLPRAELKDAVALGTVEAVQAFASEHPSTKIGSEIDAAMHEALVAQFETAKKAGTVRAVDDFARKYPDSKLDAELKSARHAIYVQAFATWKTKTQPDAVVAAFVERLLAWAEKSGNPTADVRFRLRPSKTVEDADQKTMKSGHFPGPDALPSAYITTSALRSREKRVAQDLVQGCATNFPSDVLSMRAADPLADDAPIPTNPPTLAIEYAAEWSRSNTVSPKPHTVFANFNFSFETSFVLPDAAPPYKTTVKSWRGAELWKMKTEGLSREQFQQEVYDSMMDGAFDQLDKRLMSALF